MKLRSSAIVLSTALAIACAGGGSDGGGTTGTPTSNPPAPVPPPPPTSPPPAPPPSADRVQPPIGSVANFDIVADSFVDPDGNHDQEGSATVKINQMVSWTQNGKNIHRIEFSKVPEGGNSVDSGDLRPLTTYEFRPNTAGEYVFFCRYHEYMMDVRIIVEN